MIHPDYKRLEQKYAQKVVPYHPEWVRAIGSLNAVIMLAQLAYWSASESARLAGGWFYKTVADLEAETGLTKYNQQTARKILVTLGVIETKLWGVPRKYYYRVRFDRLEELLAQDAERNAGISDLEVDLLGALREEEAEVEYLLQHGAM